MILTGGNRIQSVGGMILTGGNRTYSIDGMILTGGEQNIEYSWNDTNRGNLE
jgi:hypothetical protein